MLKTSTIIFSLFLSSSVINAQIPVGVPATGSVSLSGGGLSVNGPGIATAILTWNITQLNANTFQYVYTPNVNNGQGYLSEGAIVVQAANAAQITIANPTTFVVLGQPISLNAPGIFSASYPLPSSSDVGLAITPTANPTLTAFTFTTPYAPVWGDFAFMGSNTSNAAIYNTGFGITPTLATEGNYIPVPGNLLVAAPEPGAYALLGTFLAVGFLLKRARLSIA